MANVPSIFSSRILVMGCGNILMGDDGFGPAVADYIKKNKEVPKDVFVEDAGTAIAKILFTMVHTDTLPQRIVIIDAVQVDGKKPGEVFEIPLNNLPESKEGNYTLHQFPDTNLLKELKDKRGLDICIVACQVERIPEETEMGLSPKVEEAVPTAAKMAMEKIKS